MPAARRRWGRESFLAGAALVVAAGWLAFGSVAAREATHDAVMRVGIAGLGGAGALTVVNLLLRFLRWRMFLRALGHRLPAAEDLRLYLAGFAFTLTPGNAGEAVRTVFLHRHGVPYADGMAAVFSERLSDLAALLVLLTAGAFTIPGLRIPTTLALTAGVMAFLLLRRAPKSLATLRGLARRRGKPGTAIRHLLRMLHQARRCHARTLRLPSLLLGMAAWLAECAAFAWILRELGFEASAGFSIFAYAGAILAGAASIIPGGLGGMEATITGLLIWRGMPAPMAFASAMLVRLATLWLTVLIGLVGVAIPSRRAGCARVGPL